SRKGVGHIAVQQPISRHGMEIINIKCIKTYWPKRSIHPLRGYVSRNTLTFKPQASTRFVARRLNAIRRKSGHIVRVLECVAPEPSEPGDQDNLLAYLSAPGVDRCAVLIRR